MGQCYDLDGCDGLLDELDDGAEVVPGDKGYYYLNNGVYIVAVILFQPAMDVNFSGAIARAQMTSPTIELPSFLRRELISFHLCRRIRPNTSKGLGFFPP